MPRTTRWTALALLAFFLAGCAPAAIPASLTPLPSDTPAPSIATATLPASSTPHATASQPMPTATPEPSATSSPEPSPTPVAYDGPSLVIYLLRENTGGAVGCGDTLVPVRLNVPPSGDPLADVRTVLEFFFTPKGKYPYGLFDPLYASNIAIDDIFWGNGEIQVVTSGTLVRPEKGCGWDQIRAITNQTARSAAGGNTVEITLNNRPFNDWASADHP